MVENSAKYSFAPSAFLLLETPQISHNESNHCSFRQEADTNCKISSLKVKAAIEVPSVITETLVEARDVMVIVVGNGHGDTSSNPGRD